MMLIRSPSTSRIRAKMLYATTKDRFRRELDGVHYEIQATDPTEMDLEVLRERAHWNVHVLNSFSFKDLLGFYFQWIAPSYFIICRAHLATEICLQ